MYDSQAGGLDSFIRGLSQFASHSFDWFFTKQISRGLFTENPPFGLGHDLQSLNIQRGRDHGLSSEFLFSQNLPQIFIFLNVNN